MLRRGHILLIGGGAAIVISIAMLGYYALRLVEALEDEKYRVEPSSSATISRNITASGQAAYLASFMAFDAEARPTLAISSPSGGIVLQRTVDQPVVMEFFSIAEIGMYTLNLSNPSPDTAVEAGVILDSQEAILSRGALTPAVTVLFWLILVSGVGSVVSGIAVLLMDRRRLSKMKKFGDMSDLV
jgi:hypothetical protein